MEREKRDNGGKESEWSEVNNVSGVPDGVRAARDAVESGCYESESGKTEETAVCKSDESHGTTESRGCDKDTETVEEIWMDIFKNHDEISKYLAVWKTQFTLMESEQIRELHDMTIAMAAGLEKIAILRARENE